MSEWKKSPARFRVELMSLARNEILKAWKQGRYGCGEPHTGRFSQQFQNALDAYRDSLLNGVTTPVEYVDEAARYAETGMLEEAAVPDGETS